VAKPAVGHRARIIEAMIAVAARDGYGAASVAKVVRHAGVSRATFYEHFKDREDCFLTVFRQLAAPLTAGLEDLDDSPRKILARLLAAADGKPAAARVLLVEALGGGAAVRREHAKLFAALEAAIEGFLDRLPSDAPRLEIPARGLLGGVSGVIAIRAFRGDTGRLGELLDDILAWIESYEVPAGQPRLTATYWQQRGEQLASLLPPVEPDEEAGPLPRGRSALPAPVVASEHRARIIAATARLAKETGYATMTVADIVASAGSTREIFYGHFRSKEDAFLATQAHALEGSVSVAAAGFFGEADWSSRVWTSALATVRWVAGHADLAHVDFVESYAAGPAAIGRSFDSRMAYGLFLEDGYRQRPEAAALPRLCSETISGALLELFRCKTAAGQAERLVEIGPAGIYLVLAPFIGPTEAIELLNAKLAAEERALTS
jgi:AcrR family transcriptional regulator